MDSKARSFLSKLLLNSLSQVYSAILKFISTVKRGDVFPWKGMQMRPRGKGKKKWLFRCRLEKQGEIDEGREWGRVHIVPGLTHTFSVFFSLLCFSLGPFSLYGHFTLTTGGLFVSLSGFASLSGHLREREPEWQNEYTLEHTLSQKHIYRQVPTNKQQVWFTHTVICTQTYT